MAGKSLLRLTLAAMALALAAAAPLAAQKTELVLAIGGEPEEGYDPLLGWGRYGHPLFQSTLLARNADLTTRPDLATDWTLSGDRLVWTVTLRQDLYFSDGAPLTAEDVAFTFNGAAAAGGVLDLSAFERAEAVDATTVRFVLSRPWVTFAETFYTLGIVPSQSYGPGYARAPIGSGPYTLVSWTEGEQLIVARNPLYHGEAPAFERLVFLFAGEDTAYAAARAGQVDIVSVPALLGANTPAGFSRVVVPSVDNRGMSFPMVAPEAGIVRPDGIAVGNAVTSDPAIRRAVNLWIDRAALVEIALSGFGTPAHGPADGLPWSNPEAAVAHDPEGARALLDAAGWAPGPDGVRVKDGVRASFALYFPASDATRQALALTVAELVRDLGVEIRPTGASWDVIGRVMHSEPVLFGWGSHSPSEVHSLYAGAQAGRGNFNVGYYANPTVDAYFATAQGAESLEASYPFWRQAEWDGETGYSARGDAAWAWLVNLDHVYFTAECLDIGIPRIEPHGHGWPVTAGIASWRWTCD